MSKESLVFCCQFIVIVLLSILLMLRLTFWFERSYKFYKLQNRNGFVYLFEMASHKAPESPCWPQVEYNSITGWPWTPVQVQPPQCGTTGSHHPAQVSWGEDAEGVTLEIQKPISSGTRDTSDCTPDGSLGFSTPTQMLQCPAERCHLACVWLKPLDDKRQLTWSLVANLLQIARIVSTFLMCDY